MERFLNIQVGQEAPDFAARTLDGKELKLSDLRGKVVLLDFWATWCAPCRFQHPLLEQVKAKYKNHADIAFVSINTDEDRAVVRPFLEELGWSEAVYFEEGLSRFYRVTNIPTLMVFNKRGELVSRLAGFSAEGYPDLVVSKIEEARAE